MNSKIDLFFLVLFVIPAFIMCTHKSTHLFYNDIIKAYQDSNLNYDSKIEHILYNKLPEPKDIFERTGLGSELPKPRNAEEEQIIIQTIEALYCQFFKKVKEGGQYCPVEKIKEHYNLSPEQRIGISAGGYYRLFIAYWTFNVKLKEDRQNNISKHGYGSVYYIDSLLTFVETALAGAFFPSPGQNRIPEDLRRLGIQEFLDTFAPTMTIKELYEGADPEKVGWPILK